jgi:hypothetical protein
MISTPPPRIPGTAIARHPGTTVPPAPHTPAELHQLMRLLREARASTIAIGHGRHPASVAAATAIATAWTAEAGTVQGVADWPEDAASWLRPACRLAAGSPDALVIAATPASFAQLAQRLAAQAGWSPSRTLGFASLASADLAALTEADLSGMTGATATGGTWLIRRALLIVDDSTGADRAGALGT